MKGNGGLGTKGVLTGLTVWSWNLCRTL